MESRKPKFFRTLLGGIFATVAMTVVIFILAATGLPEMNPPDMLASLLNVSLPVGWGLHLAIGVVFALIYAYGFVYLVKSIPKRVVKGGLYGVVVFIIAQVAVFILDSMQTEIPVTNGNMSLMAIVSLIGHVVFGIVQAQFIKTGQPIKG
jgi:hypothetical protein